MERVAELPFCVCSVPPAAEGFPECRFVQLSVEIAHDQKPFASGLAQERIGHSREPDGRTGTVGFVVEFRGEVTHQQARFVSYQVAPKRNSREVPEGMWLTSEGKNLSPL